MRLRRAVHRAFPADNAFIAVKALVVDPRRENILGTLMSLDMIGCEPPWRGIKPTHSISWVSCAIHGLIPSSLP